MEKKKKGEMAFFWRAALQCSVYIGRYNGYEGGRRRKEESLHLNLKSRLEAKFIFPPSPPPSKGVGEESEEDSLPSFGALKGGVRRRGTKKRFGP